MNPLGVVEINIVLHPAAQLWQTHVLPDFDVFVLQRPPETLHFGVVQAATTPIHADLNIMGSQLICELLAGKLTALIRIEDLRLPMALNCILQGLYATNLGQPQGIGREDFFVVFGVLRLLFRSGTIIVSEQIAATMTHHR